MEKLKELILIEADEINKLKKINIMFYTLMNII
jgi:hypothetical protein